MILYLEQLAAGTLPICQAFGSYSAAPQASGSGSAAPKASGRGSAVPKKPMPQLGDEFVPDSELLRRFFALEPPGMPTMTPPPAAPRVVTADPEPEQLDSDSEGTLLYDEEDLKRSYLQYTEQPADDQPEEQNPAKKAKLKAESLTWLMKPLRQRRRQQLPPPREHQQPVQR